VIHYQQWGEGDPLIALHPLALESSAFTGVGAHLANLGIRTLACDLPGFGKTPTIEGPLTPAALAEPVIRLARSLERPPILLGMSLGGRVALEVALQAPESVRGLVLIAPYLPWRRYHQLNRMARFLDPQWGHRLPLERLWPLLKFSTIALEGLPALEHDWLARACVRVAYYSTCPDTRVAFLSAARELALDPAVGESALWERLRELRMPTSWLWAGRDRLIPRSHAAAVVERMPHSGQFEAPCSGHFVNFRHYRCMEQAIGLAVAHVLDVEAGRALGDPVRRVACLRGRGRGRARTGESEETTAVALLGPG